MLEEMKPILLHMLPKFAHNECTSYTQSIQQVSGELRSLVYRAICPYLCKKDQVLLFILLLLSIKN